MSRKPSRRTCDSIHTALHAEFKFRFVSNGDGSFHILTASSNLTKALYETENVHYEGSSSYSVKSKEYDEDDPAFKWYLNLLHSS